MTLELKSISKVFPGVKALDNVSLTFRPGEVHALLGENGAGKSTLIKIICGIYQASDGEVVFEGQTLQIGSLKDGMAQGITIVNQEIQVFSESSLSENIMMDKLEMYSSGGRIDWQRMHREARQYLAQVGLNLEPEMPIGSLSAAQKQLVQIAKALSRDAKVILLDEPTSSITKAEVENLFRLMRELRDNGVTLILVSHKLEEVMEICDVVSVLRDGKHVATKPMAGLSREDIIEMMIGRKMLVELFDKLDVDTSDVVLETHGLSAAGLIENASFQLRKGEILGFYGLVGAGRTELVKTIIGHYRKTSGRLEIHGETAEVRNVADCLERFRVGYISENRKEDGLFLDFDIETNLTVTIWKRLANTTTRAINMAAQAERADELMAELDVRATGRRQKVGNLSGGNQQKISIGKWLAADCDILIIDEPTVGVDVGAKTTIHRIIHDLAKAGKSIILISSDMPEMLSLASRILVFKEQEIMGEVEGVSGGARSLEEVGRDVGQLMA